MQEAFGDVDALRRRGRRETGDVLFYESVTCLIVSYHDQKRATAFVQ